VVFVSLIFITLIFLTGAEAGGDKATAPEPLASTSNDSTTLVILAPEGPVFAELLVSVAEKRWRLWIADFLSRGLDQDKSGTLDRNELELLTPGLRSLAGISSVESIFTEASSGQAGQSPQDSLPVSEFSQWFQHRIPPSLELSAAQTNADDSVRLLSRLDVNSDGIVSLEELQRSEQTLRFRDLDDDQTFSISELMPFRDPLSQQAPLAPDAADLPFFEITDLTSAERAADRLIARYGTNGTLNSRIFRLRNPETDASSEKSGEEYELNREQLTQHLLKPACHLRLSVRLSDKANRSQTTIDELPGDIPFIQTTRQNLGTTLIQIDDMKLEVIARGGGANNRAYAKGFLGQSFAMQDADKNQYLDQQEFSQLSGVLTQAGLTADFRAVDMNNDQMVTRDELFRFGERESLAAGSKIEVTVEQHGATLFSLIDRNHDRRLSPREINEASAQIESMNINGDAGLGDSDFGTTYRLRIGLGRTDLQKKSASPVSSMTQQSLDAVLPGFDALQGPEWFRRMDRNQDGDVSLREFPGPIDTFRKLDQDGDELLSVSEAESVSSTD
jgi:Ca2+-binding EF-hand superfamily protein